MGSWGFPGGAVVKNLPANLKDIGDEDSIPESVRSPGVGNGNPSQYSCLENSTDSSLWWATVHGVTKNWAQLSNLEHTHRHTHTHTHTHTDTHTHTHGGGILVP